MDIFGEKTASGFSLPEISIGEQIETLQGDPARAMDQVELEKFMNEPVTIVVPRGGSESDIDAWPIQVGSRMQYIVRGKAATIKRKYVEVLARSFFSRFEARQENPIDPASIYFHEIKTVSYPFSVLEDKNPKGRAWLQRIVDNA